MSQYKTMTEDETINHGVFRDFHLTTLMIDSHKERSSIKRSFSYPVHLLLKEVLDPYGLHLFGAFNIDEYQVKAVSINRDFPAENELIIKQMYGWKGGVTVHIGFSGAGDCAYEVLYDVDSGACIFQKLVFGSTRFSREYKTFSAMMKQLREVSAGIEDEDLLWDELLKEPAS